MAKKLFVGGLSWDTTDAKLSEFFAQSGTVVSASVITDKFSGKSRGFGFVEMSTDEEADQAKEKLNGQTLDGRTIAVNEARPREEGTNNSSGGGFNRRGGRNDRSRTDKGPRGGRGGRY